MRKLIAFLLLLSLFLTTAVFAQEATPAATGVAPKLPDLLTLLQTDPQGQFTTLLAALDAAGLTDTLTGDGPFTLLAPTNDAFDALLAQTGMTQDELFAQQDVLREVLRYHLIAGKYFYRNLTAGPTLDTELEGQQVTFARGQGGVMTVNGANVTDEDNIASNGILDVIDTVLAPPDVAAAMMAAEATEAPTVEAPVATPAPTQAAGVPAELPDLLTLLANDPQGQFTTLLAVINATNVKDLLSGAGPFTLLAPTNDAFDALLAQTGMTQDQLLADSRVLNQVLLQHIIRGRYFYRNLTSGPTLPTALLGQSVTFGRGQGGVLTVNDVTISDEDNLASNGVLDVLDGVIVPPSVAAALATPEPTEVATEAVATEAPTAEPTQAAGVPAALPDLLTLLQTDPQGQFTTLLAAIDAAGLTDILKAGNPFTLLAPTNDAFDALLAQTGMTQDELLADKNTVAQILLYHMIPGRYFYRNLTAGPTLTTALLGQSVTFGRGQGGVLTANDVTISDEDNVASNGILDVVDGVILPPSVLAAMTAAEATEVPTVEAPTATPAPTQAAGVPAELPDLLTLLANDPQGQFTTLLAVINATNVKDLLSGAGPFTLLAPTNDAFDALLAQTGMTQDELLASPQTLNQILLQHIIRGRYFYRNLTSGPTLPTALLGQSVTFGRGQGGVLTVNDVTISDEDNVASNGILDVLDGVIVPPSVAAALATPEPTEAPTAEPTQAAGVAPQQPDLLTLLQTDSQGQFTTLLAAIDAAGLTDTLSSGGPFTLLAPTNDAFDALLAQTGMTQDELFAQPDVLREILLYHAIPGKYFYRNLTAGPTLDTELEGQQVTFAIGQGGVLSVNGASVTDEDNIASNGILDVIDTVLLPPSVAAALMPAEATEAPTETPTPAPTQAAGVAPERPNLIALMQADPQGQFTTLLAAIDAAGLTDTLSNGGPFTLLAPTNDAFAALLAQTGMTQDQLLADTHTLSQILQYHVVVGKYFYRNLTAGPTLATLLQDQQVTFGRGQGGVLTVNDVTISDEDNLASNGVLDVLDGVILPPSVAAALATPEPTEVAPTETPTPEPTAVPTEVPTAVAGGAHLRVAHFSADAGAVDIYINGTISSWTNVSFPTISDWMSLDPGAYTIGIAQAGGSPSTTANVTLRDGAYVTVAVTGSAASSTLKATVLVEDFSTLSAGNARLSVFNGVEGSASNDVLVDGKAVVSLLGYPGTQGGNDGFYTVDVPAGTHEIQFVSHSDHSKVLIDLSSLTMDAGTNYFVAAVGTADSPGAVSTSAPVATS